MKTIAEQMSFYGAKPELHDRVRHLVEDRMREHNDKQRWCEEMT